MKQILSAMVCAALLGSGVSSFSLAQDQIANSPDAPSVTGQQQSKAEIAAIRTASEAFVLAFNKADAKAVAAFWTEDGEYIDDTGLQFTGREAIEEGYAKYFAANPNTKIKITIDSLRLVSSDAAIEDGRAVTDPQAAGVAGFSKYTATHVKVDGKWLMASVRDTLVEMPVKAASSADFEWLVGTWVAEEHGVEGRVSL